MILVVFYALKVVGLVLVESRLLEMIKMECISQENAYQDIGVDEVRESTQTSVACVAPKDYEM
jgi:hypothetical protein